MKHIRLTLHALRYVLPFTEYELADAIANSIELDAILDELKENDVEIGLRKTARKVLQIRVHGPHHSQHDEEESYEELLSNMRNNAKNEYVFIAEPNCDLHAQSNLIFDLGFRYYCIVLLSICPSSITMPLMSQI